MDTNSDLQQTITFIGGMDSDTPDLYLNGTTYREAVNMRLGIDEEGVGVLRAIPSFVESDKLQLQLGAESPWLIVQTFEFRDENVHILRNDEYWCVVLCNGDDLDHANRILKAKQSDWEIGEGDKVSVTFSYESVDNQKMYLANGKQPMLIVPLNYVSQGDLFVFNENDINKLISYPSALLLPVKISRITLGNLIYGRVSYSYRLYNKYLGATEPAIPTRLFHVVHYQGSGLQTRGGNVGENSNMGLEVEISIDDQQGQFEYILIFRIQYTDPGQPAQVHVVYDGKIVGSPIKFVDNTQESLSQMSVAEFNSLNGVHIIPQAIDNKEDRLFAANIKETDTRIVDEIVKDYDTRAFRFTIDQDQNTAYANLYQYQQLLNPTTITVNLSEQVDDGLFLESTVSNIPDYNHDCYNSYNDINSISVTIGTGVEKYDVSGYYGGTGKNISYRLVVGDIIGDSNVSKSDDVGLHRAAVLATDNTEEFSMSNGQSVSCVTKYGLKSQYSDLYKLDQLGDSIGCSYSNPFVSSAMPSLKHDEIYRYGIVFYDTYGNKSSVKWIGDIRTPMVRENYCGILRSYKVGNSYGLMSGFATFTQNGKIKKANGQYSSKAYELITHPIGVLFFIRNLPEQIVRYEIVRAKKTNLDTKNISLGILFSVGINTSENTGFRYSQAIPSITLYFLYNYYRSKQGSLYSDITSALYLFASPEVCYNEGFLLGNKLHPIFLTFSIGANKEVTTGNPSTVILYPSTAGFHIKYWAPNDGNITGGTDPQLWRVDLDSLGEDYIYEQAPDSDPIKYTNHFPADSFYSSPYLQGGNHWYGYAIPKKIDSESMQLEDYYHNVIEKQTVVNSSSSDPFDLEKWIELIKNSYAYLKNYCVCDGSLYYDSTHTFQSSKDVWFGHTDLDIPITTTFDIEKCVSLNSAILGWNSLSDNSGKDTSSLNYHDSSIAIGEYAFINYLSSGAEYDKPENPILQFIVRSDLLCRKEGDGRYKQPMPVGPGGAGALLLLNTAVFAGYRENQSTIVDARTSINSEFGPVLCNIQHTVSPYGGGYSLTRKLTSYSSYCDCHKVYGRGTLLCTVFDGDTYILPFEYISMHKWYDPYEAAAEKTSIKHMVVSTTPVETSIDFVYSHGNEFSAKASNIATNLQEKPTNVYNVYIQENSLYKYNDTYTGHDSSSSYIAFDEDRLDSDINQDCRIYASEIKMPNEAIDNWRIFKPTNYIDVESKYGEITNIRNFRNNLVYWQVNAMGVASVNERLILTSDSNELLVIGSGGVLSRYDYVSTQYGMKQKSFNDALSDSALYWVDVNRAAILAYNGQVDNIARNKKVQTYINNENQSFDNPQTYYNPNSKEVLFDGMKSVKATQCLLSMDPNEYEDAQGYSFSLIYNEELQSFTSILLTDENSTMSIENQTNPYNWSIKLGSYIGLDDYYLAVNKCVGDVQDSSVTTTVNKGSLYTKVFDNMELDIQNRENLFDFDHLYDSTMSIIFLTSLGQRAKFEDQILNDREYNRRIAIPRSNTYDELVQQSRNFGDRLRGRTMNVLIKPSIDQLYNNCAPSLSCITTKFRMSLA